MSLDVESLESDLARAKEEIAGPVPLMESAPDCLVTLPRGIMNNGTFQTRAEVRELNGMDEEQLARYRKPEEIFDGVLAVGTVKIGSLDLQPMAIGERQVHLRQLLIGEREQLFLAIARVTYGDERRFPVKCKDCGREQELGIKLSEDFLPRETKGDMDRPFHFTTSHGQVLEVRLATGADQLELFREGVSMAEMNTIMLSRCIVSIDGGVVVDPPSLARSLSMRDRSALIAELLARQPMAESTITFPCHGCQEEQQVSFAWLDFFRL